MSTKKSSKRVQQQFNSISPDFEKRSPLYWSIYGFIVLFLFIAPFSRALFNGGQLTFNKPIAIALIWSSIFLLITAVALLLRWKMENRIDLIQFIVWLIPLAYLLALIQAASLSFALQSLYIHILYVTMFLIGFYLTRRKAGAYWVQGSLLLSGYMIIVFGFMNWFGDASIFGLIQYDSGTPGKFSSVYRDAVLVDANGQRLTSVFQYANTYAAYLIALIIASLIIVSLSRRRVVVLAGSFMLVPGIISLLLTLSRGGMVVFPVVVLLVLPLLAISRQILFFIHAVIALLASLSISGTITAMGLSLQKSFSASGALKAWGILVLVSLLYSGIALIIQRYLEPLVNRWTAGFAKRRFSSLTLPVIGLLAGAIGFYVLFGDTGFTKLLPESIKNRVENINFQQHSVLERGTFYKDGVKLFKDYPILGAGGGAWYTLYEKYQNNPYVSRQAHNFFLQYLVETGLVGLIFLLLLLAAVFYTYIRSFFRNPDASDKYDHLIYYIVPVAILTHSLIDFNMSYAYIGALVFLSLGGMLGGSKTSELSPSLQVKLRKWSKAYPAFIAVVAIVLLVMSGRLYAAANLYTSATDDLKNQKPFTQAVEKLNKAIAYSSNPDYAAAKAQVLIQAYKQTNKEEFYEEAASTLANLGKQEPYSHAFIESEIALYSAKQDWGHLQQVFAQAVEYYSWDITVYDRAIALNYQMGADRIKRNQQQEAQSYWDAALNLYQEVKKRIAELALLPKEQNQGRAFQITPNMGLAVGQIYYSRGAYPEAAEVFRSVLDPNQLTQPEQQDLAAYYLVSLQKQGKQDQDLYNRLVQAAPGKLNAIEALAR
ncbi:O-antigen ligase family protein [Ferviditalea candida]|uniref:O-antigen ligase family protein n=1 Tax=Ferviditalea candida TaxID=3108399 RepID=A0ABU5ZEL1_9BACL|nr:O-antigen ligase family protein [Paenibacillaceae bacterium T2]